MSRSRLSWDDVDYCIPYDDCPDYEEGRAPLPILSKDAYDWLSFANQWVLRYFGSIQRNILDDLLSTLPYIARHIVAGYVLKDSLTPFCALSERQIIRDRGLSPNAERRVRHILRVYELKCVSDNATYYARVTRAAITSGAKPLICRMQVGNGARVSTYRLPDIRPVDRWRLLGANIDASGTEEDALAVDGGGEAVEFRHHGDEVATVDSTPVDELSTALTTLSVEIKPARGHSIGPDAVVDARGARGELVKDNSNPSLSVLVTQDSLKRKGRARAECRTEEAYARLIAAFGTSAGSKGVETRAAFERLIERGYDPETVIAAARRYRASSDPHQWRYPLMALEDPGWVSSYCGAPRRLLDPDWSLASAPIARAPLRDGGSLVYALLVKGPTGESVDSGLTVAPSASEGDARQMLLEQKDEVLKRLGL